MAAPPYASNQTGTGDLEESSLVRQIRKMAERGPTALETSLLPWAKLATAQVRTWRKE